MDIDAARLCSLDLFQRLVNEPPTLTPGGFVMGDLYPDAPSFTNSDSFIDRIQ